MDVKWLVFDSAARISRPAKNLSDAGAERKVRGFVDGRERNGKNDSRKGAKAQRLEE
jgi:hypothetical protein